MRRLLVSVVLMGIVTTTVIAMAASAGSNGSARASAPNVRARCTGTTGLDVYLWPRGHEAVPALGFPAFAKPHMEFYRARDVSNSTGYLAFIDPTQLDVASSCAAIGDRAMAPLAGTPVFAFGPAAQKVRCTVTGNLEIRLAPYNVTTTRIVRKVVFVRVKGKRVRKVITRRVKTVTRRGSDATASVEGIADTLVSVRIFASPTANSYARWDPRYCTAVGLTD